MATAARDSTALIMTHGTFLFATSLAKTALSVELAHVGSDAERDAQKHCRSCCLSHVCLIGSRMIRSLTLPPQPSSALPFSRCAEGGDDALTQGWAQSAIPPRRSAAH